jgi:hypothetical protein
MADKGRHTTDEQEAVVGRHVQTVPLENQIMAEHGRPLRGAITDPFCGESRVTGPGEQRPEFSAIAGHAALVARLGSMRSHARRIAPGYLLLREAAGAGSATALYSDDDTATTCSTAASGAGQDTRRVEFASRPAHDPGVPDQSTPSTRSLRSQAAQDS